VKLLRDRFWALGPYLCGMRFTPGIGWVGAVVGVAAPVVVFRFTG
jgi:hypothetical protein